MSNISFYYLLYIRLLITSSFVFSLETLLLVLINDINDFINDLSAKNISCIRISEIFLMIFLDLLLGQNSLTDIFYFMNFEKDIVLIGYLISSFAPYFDIFIYSLLVMINYLILKTHI